MPDKKQKTAFNHAAPTDERTDALSQLQKEHMPTGLSDLIPNDEVKAVINEINAMYDEARMQKSLQNNVVVPFPNKHAKKHGMQSVQIDNWQIQVNLDFWERQGLLNFDSIRMMVAQTPILNSVIMTRTRQVQRFSRVAENDSSFPGFEIRHRDRKHKITESEQKTIDELARFMTHCGWEFNARRRKELRRDSFSQFMGKAVRDSLTMDSLAIETEWKNNKAQGLDGFYCIDGGSIRLCTESGYRGNEEIIAVQVVNGQVHTAYTWNDIIYEPRNPRSDVSACGYGLSETELLIRVVTGFLNALTYNLKGFDTNAIPKGILHLSGNYTPADLEAFRRYWASMVKGVNNQWALPVLVSKDQESKATFEKLGCDFDEMMFAKFITFLTSIICSIFGMSPSEISFDSFTAGNTSALNGTDTAEKLAASKDSGLRPLLSYFENLFTDYVISDFSDDYVFRFTGLDPEDAERKFEKQKLILTVDELRAEEGYEKHDDPLMGAAPLNPSLMGTFMSMTEGLMGGVSDEEEEEAGGNTGNGGGTPWGQE